MGIGFDGCDCIVDHSSSFDLLAPMTRRLLPAHTDNFKKRANYGETVAEKILSRLFNGLNASAAGSPAEATVS